MTNERMDELLRDEFGDDLVEGREGAWRIVLSEDDEELPEGEAEQSDDLDDSDLPKLESSDEQSDDAEEDGEEEELPGASVEERLSPVMVVLTDSRADRMRLMMPIRSFDPRKTQDLRLALIALDSNYDRALDARYAIQDGVLWSVFIHPLESLTDADLKNGIDQVRTLRKNTGTSFTSSEMLFGAAPKPQEEQAEEEKDAEVYDF